MADNTDLIMYVDSPNVPWRDTRPGSRRKVLHQDAATGQLTMPRPVGSWLPDECPRAPRVRRASIHPFGYVRGSQARIRTGHVYLESGGLGASVLHA